MTFCCLNHPVWITAALRNDSIFLPLSFFIIHPLPLYSFFTLSSFLPLLLLLCILFHHLSLSYFYRSRWQESKSHSAPIPPYSISQVWHLLGSSIAEPLSELFNKDPLLFMNVKQCLEGSETLLPVYSTKCMNWRKSLGAMLLLPFKDAEAYVSLVLWHLYAFRDRQSTSFRVIQCTANN